MKLGDLPGIALIFVFTIMVIAIGVAIQSDVRTDLVTDYGNDSEAVQVIDDGIDATGVLSSKTPLIALIIVFSIILGVLGTMMYNRIG